MITQDEVRQKLIRKMQEGQQQYIANTSRQANANCGSLPCKPLMIIRIVINQIDSKT